METRDFSDSKATRFTVICETTMQVCRQLAFSDEPISLFCDSTRGKSWLRMAGMFPNGKLATMLELVIPIGVTLRIVLPVSTTVNVSWITKPELVAIARQDAKGWPTLGSK